MLRPLYKIERFYLPYFQNAAGSPEFVGLTYAQNKHNYILLEKLIQHTFV